MTVRSSYKAPLKRRPADDRDAEIARLAGKLGDLTMTSDLLEAKIDRLVAALLPAGGRNGEPYRLALRPGPRARLGRPTSVDHPGHREHDGTIRTERVDEIPPTRSGSHGDPGSWPPRFAALERLRRAVRHGFGAFGEGVAAGIKLRHDPSRASPPESSRPGCRQRRMTGILASHGPVSCRDRIEARLAVQGNGCVERFSRVLGVDLR